MYFKRLDPYRVQLPMQGNMNVPGVIYATDALLPDVESDNAHKQVANVACLPGIVGASLAMPDIHWGYGFPIGGVAAFDAEQGIISPGGVGYDINCGVRLATLDMTEAELRPQLANLVDALYAGVPSGVGRGGDVATTKSMVRAAAEGGAGWAVKRGFGEKDDLERIENGGALPGADVDQLSERAVERGRGQVGTLGSGNHFIELGVVDEVFDAETADAFGLALGQVTLMIHSGSRGLGYQVCDDFLAKMIGALNKKKVQLPDRQLVYAQFESPLGKRYFGAMNAAANYAFANRQVMMGLAGEIIADTLDIGPARLGMRLVYDVCHNIAKVETHEVKGRRMKLVVHRKGATRAFGPGQPDLPQSYQQTGQPVLIPGDMGRASYVLVGTQKAMEQTFGSTCHGAGRVLSRKAAIRQSKGRRIADELAQKGIIVRGRGRTTLQEEMPDAYKDVSQVVDVVHGAGISRKVVRLRPLGVAKG